MLDQVRTFIITQEKTLRFYYFAGFIGAFAIIMFGFMYYFYSSVHGLEQRISRINRQREETRTILQKHALVKQQQAEVDAILAKDSSFRIKEYFTSVINELGLMNNATKPAEVTEPQDLTPNYAEIKLDASFSDINMKQLVELLYKIEQNERIYTKELVITKAQKGRSLDVTLVIATLQQKTPAT